MIRVEYFVACHRYEVLVRVDVIKNVVSIGNIKQVERKKMLAADSKELKVRVAMALVPRKQQGNCEGYIIAVAKLLAAVTRTSRRANKACLHKRGAYCD